MRTSMDLNSEMAQKRKNAVWIKLHVKCEKKKECKQIKILDEMNRLVTRGCEQIGCAKWMKKIKRRKLTENI